MSEQDPFHFVTVGWDCILIEGLCDPVAARIHSRFSHLLHPRYTSVESGLVGTRSDVYFFRRNLRQLMPQPDHELLASLEREGVPTIHNMIMGDRIVSTLSYPEALSYATFLARRTIDVFTELKPSVIIGGFDALHGSIALAVARSMGIPWFALHFTVIPSGLACFCDRVSPAARVVLRARAANEMKALAEKSLHQFESRKIQASAYIAPSPSFRRTMAKLPARVSAAFEKIRNPRRRDLLKFTESPSGRSVTGALKFFYRTRQARKALGKIETLAFPPATPYVLFGLHMQPESSIDVWAPFFSNQVWVIELLSRSIPPSHKLLVKIHKSDTANYSQAQLQRMSAFPGVELVRPFVDTRQFIERAALIISIQGTMGLEAALLGKPVITMDESPFAGFPSVSRMEEVLELPRLIRQKLTEKRPDRSEIIAAYASYLAPFFPASSNSWGERRSEAELDGYAVLFDALRQYLLAQHSIQMKKEVL